MRLVLIQQQIQFQNDKSIQLSRSTFCFARKKAQQYLHIACSVENMDRMRAQVPSLRVSVALVYFRPIVRMGFNFSIFNGMSHRI